MKKIYSLLIIALLLTSCVAPQMVIQLTPEAPEGKYEMGREYISLSNDSIDVELGYDGVRGEHLIFDFVVVNRTPYELSINPSDFYYVVLDSALADSSKLPPRMAIHPERILHHYDETLETKQGAKEINSFLGFLDAGVDLLVNTTAFIATEDPGYVVDAIFSTLDNVDYYVSKDNQISADISMINSEKEVVNEEIFRPGKIPSGKVMNGYVFFPKHPDTEYYMFCFPMDDQLFQFVYHQNRMYQYF